MLEMGWLSSNAFGLLALVFLCSWFVQCKLVSLLKLSKLSVK
jgi:hypothetical protein